jgi:hypothetical protein
VTAIKKAKIPVASEHQEQKNLFEWAELASGRHPELALMFAVPNGGARNIVVAKKLKAEGVKAGVPDIILPVARKRFHGLAIEMKRMAGGRVSDDQLFWLDALTEQSWLAVVCKGWEEAVAVIDGYLND